MGCGSSSEASVASVSHLKLDRHRSKELWSELRRRLHIDNDLENAVARDDLFKLMDTSKKGVLTLEDAMAGCNTIVGLPELINNVEPIVTRAFKAACARTKKRERTKIGGGENLLLGSKEFLAFLTYVRDYCELWVMFDEVDSSDDFAITLEEFKTAIPLLQLWGKGMKIKDPEATFAAIDTNNDMVVSFIEFAEWAIVVQLDYDADDDDVGARAPPPSSVEPDYFATIQSCAAKKQAQLSQFQKLKERLPLDNVTPEEVERRMQLFTKFDVIRNRRLTLPEVMMGCRNVLRLSEITPHSDAIATHAFREARRSTFHADTISKKTVSFLEFRLLLCYIYDYFELSYMFSLIDTDHKEMKPQQGGLQGGGTPMDASLGGSFAGSRRGMLSASGNRNKSPSRARSPSGSQRGGSPMRGDSFAAPSSPGTAGLNPLHRNGSRRVLGNTLSVPSNTHGVTSTTSDQDSSPLIDFTGGDGKAYTDGGDDDGRRTVSVGDSSMTVSINPAMFNDGNFITLEELTKAKDHLATWLRRPVIIDGIMTDTNIAAAAAGTVPAAPSGNKKNASKVGAQDGPLYVSDIFKAADENGDSRISFMEFVSWAVRNKLDADGTRRFKAIGRPMQLVNIHQGGGVQSMQGGSILF